MIGLQISFPSFNKKSTKFSLRIFTTLPFLPPTQKTVFCIISKDYRTAQRMVMNWIESQVEYTFFRSVRYFSPWHSVFSIVLLLSQHRTLRKFMNLFWFVYGLFFVLSVFTVAKTGVLSLILFASIEEIE